VTVGDALARYEAAFGEMPPLMALLGADEQPEKLAAALLGAVAAGEPFATDAELRAALGIAEPPENAVV
jgi:hypothetical protein